MPESACLNLPLFHDTRGLGDFAERIACTLPTTAFDSIGCFSNLAYRLDTVDIDVHTEKYISVIQNYETQETKRRLSL